MTGLDGRRVYLDWNATAPLRPEARAAMLAAMDVVGNPSSVHAEGRAAKAIVEKARRQVAALVGCEPDALIFTSGATEAMAIADGYLGGVAGGEIEHDCVRAYLTTNLAVDSDGQVEVGGKTDRDLALQTANSETGILQRRHRGEVSLVDAVQAIGKTPWVFEADRMRFALVSGHKFGAPTGVGALIQQVGICPLRRGGGQERNFRPGTENVIGIAGFGAAAEAARRDLEDGVWERVAKLRDDLEYALAAAGPDLQIFGKGAARLPNTSCFAVRGWKGETQVMQMDLAGFAVSAGSACSSGKVNKASRVLLAMGCDEVTASSAIRVSMGPTTTEAEVMAFADAWIEHYRRRRERAA